MSIPSPCSRTGKFSWAAISRELAEQFRSRIARLDGTTGAADLSFNPGANELVRAIVLESNGSMLIGGDFSNVAATNRSRIARLDFNGLADATFDPDGSSFSSVYSIVPDATGRILVGRSRSPRLADSR